MGSKRTQLHLILLLLAYYCSAHIDANGGNDITVHCLPDEAASLLQLKRSFHNPILSSWQHGTDCCHWEGVGCDKASGQVVTLDLSHHNLQSKGDLSPALFNLTSLTNLSLSGNDFNNASLPKFGFEQLTNLLSLDLSYARLSGQIPIGIAHLKNLLTLDLSNNNMYVREPSFQSLVANLSNLRELYLDSVGILSGGATWSVGLADSVPLLQDISLSGCGLGGPIHHSFSRLRFLAMIDLSECGLSGHVPRLFAEFSFLLYLNLLGNDFEGQFPAKIFQLKNLRYLDVSLNPSLSVQLPDFPPVNNMESLSLLETNFSGAIPDSIVHLKSLEFLGLSNIGSPSQRTTSIGNLTSLNTLWLLGSGIENPTLSWIGRLKNLAELSLEGYNLSGPIPWWIRNCTSLTTLSLHDCSLSGPIPLWMGNLTKLSHLDLSHNGLSGKIPMVQLALSSLETLFLSSNELNGTLDDIPDPLSSFLHSIDLSSNNLTGHIPKSFFDLTGLEDLWLNSNQFDGTVELSLLWKVRTLGSLALSDNMLSVIDVEDGYPFPYLHGITQLRLASCNLKKFPVALRYANEMFDLDLSNNRIDGAIPSWIWMNWKDTISSLNLSNNMFTSLENSPSVLHVKKLNVLDLSSNKLRGSVPIPHTTSKFDAEALLDYSNNNFSSIIPDFGRYLPNITIYLNLSRNKLCGHIPRSICTKQYLQILDLSYNNFRGRLPSCLTQGSSLIMLKLRDNHFHGVLPENIGEGCMLQTIDMNNNQIEEKIPRSLSNCRSLQVIDMGRNRILDSFPSWLGDMSNLRILILRSNQFYGPIGGPTASDATSKHFSRLQIIDLASNNFSGSLNSKWFGKLETMMDNSSGQGNALSLDTTIHGEYYQEILTFKGIDLPFTKILSTFKMIDFSNNRFDGPIPESIGKLIALHGLNMSHNAFTRGIPSMLGDLAQLESLDLSRNKLSGVIPQELANLTYLAVLNLSYNDLTGMVPKGPQFSIFANSSFEGNEGLCGRPLSKQCDSSGTGTPSSSVSSKDSVGTIVLFVFVGSGFGVGFAVALVLSVVWQAKRWKCNCSLFHW